MKISSAESAALVTLIEKFGSIRNCAKKLQVKLKDSNFKEQNLINWRLRGYVPLDKVIKIAKAFDVAPHILNYEGMNYITGEDNGSYRSYLTDTFNENQIKFIMKYKPAIYAPWAKR